jgi:hypothetical protein
MAALVRNAIIRTPSVLWQQTMRWQQTLVLRGIPRNATVDEVHAFLDGKISKNNIDFRMTESNTFSGWAHVKCADKAEEQVVKSKHMANIRHRYIEVLNLPPRSDRSYP